MFVKENPDRKKKQKKTNEFLKSFKKEFRKLDFN